MFEHHAAAFRAEDAGRALPGHEVAVRIVFAAVITASLSGLADHDLSAAFRTFDAGLLKIRLVVLAFRETRAGQELAVRTVFDDHHAAAFIADHIGYFIFDLDALDLLLGLFHGGFKVRIEIADNGFLIDNSLTDFIEQ